MTPARQLLAALVCAVALLLLGGVWEARRYWLVAGATVGVGGALLIFLRTLLKRTWDLQGHVDSITRSSMVDLAIELHAMQIITRRFPEADMPTTNWTIRFSNLHHVVRSLDENDPDVIVEFGSGLSTICIASWIKQRGRGRLISFEHDCGWAEVTQRHLQQSGLSNAVRMVTAPLTPKLLRDGTRVNWYDDSVGQELEGLVIDFAVIDGPPGGTNAKARLPAVDFLIPRLSPSAVVIIDDTLRNGERHIAEQFASSLPGHSILHFHTLSGISVVTAMRRRSDDEARLATTMESADKV